MMGQMLEHKVLLAIFGVVVLGFLVLDLGILSKRARVISLKESLVWTAFWLGLALLFAACVWYRMGRDDAVTFVTAYVVEQSLSIDNLFVFLLIFQSFRVKPELQHRVLFWGIIGALLMRALCIGVGVAALSRFSWLVYIFGAILIVGGIKTAFERDDDDEAEDPNSKLAVRLVRKVLPVTGDFRGDRFFVREDGSLKATQLLLALATVEVSDVIFAVDSIPAVLAISIDPFIVYTSNIFAILGLRSIYFALAHLMRIFRYIKYALALILIFIGVKIALSHHVEIPTPFALGVVGLLLLLSVLASVVIKPKAGGVA